MAGSVVPPLVLHVPHASTSIPADMRATLLLDEADLAAEILRMTDAFTDELFGVSSDRATTVAFPVSRLVVDPERFQDDAQERMAERGMGVVYVRTSDGRRLREAPGAPERAALLARFYEPHHAALMAAVDLALSRWARCLVLDAHSFPSTPLPYEPDQSPSRPDICLGTDSFHTPRWLLDRARVWLEGQGLSVDVDRPFSGAMVPASHYRKDVRVVALMVEVNRKLYMDERTGARSPAFARVHRLLDRMIHFLEVTTQARA